MIQFDMRKRCLDEAVSSPEWPKVLGPDGDALEKELDEEGITPEMAVRYIRENYTGWAGIVSTVTRFKHWTRKQDFRAYMKGLRERVRNMCRVYMDRYRDLKKTGVPDSEILMDPDNPYYIPLPVIADLLLKKASEIDDDEEKEEISNRLREIKEETEYAVRSRPYYLNFLYHLNRASVKGDKPYAE